MLTASVLLICSLFFNSLGLISTTTAAPRCEFNEPFAPSEGWVKPAEKPYRDEVCLNGTWDFAPAAIPADFKPFAGEPPELKSPPATAWEKTAIKIPSPWNVNAWGAGRNVGAGTEHPYWPGSVYYPSYPAHWDSVEMGWLRRRFKVPSSWSADQRILLHFEAVAGECQILINRKQAGEHFDKYLPFEIDITDLITRSGSNELLVGVRSHSLFRHRSEKYPRMVSPFPTGSETERLVGIWQDVFLLSVPTVRVSDVTVQPLVGEDVLQVSVDVRNDTGKTRTVRVECDVLPWINQAGTDVLTAPVPHWKLADPALSFKPLELSVAAGQHATTVMRIAVNHRLNGWKPGSPNLYTAHVSLHQGEHTVDLLSTRFGWREFTIKGKDLLLNGDKIQLAGDLLHPFGPFIMSRRYVWAWYKMIQDMGGNCVRPHGQIHPRHYLDLADEMGVVVLDETALFGSSISLNFDDPIAWRRFQDHFSGLIHRDCNHPCVLGWSFGNELFAIFNLNQVRKEDGEKWYGQLAQLSRTDSTHAWVSCDGDDDLRGHIAGVESSLRAREPDRAIAQHR